MTFYEILFPENISYGMKGGPQFSTDVIKMSGGQEQRNINWIFPKHKYNVSHALIDKNKIDQLMIFFRICKGKAVGFRFKDWLDYQVEKQELFVADGTIDKIQMFKQYKIDKLEIKRVLKKIVTNSTKVFFDDVIQNNGYSVDDNSGILNFVTPPTKGVKVTYSCEFHVPVRFDQDYFDFTMDKFNIYNCNNIELVEINI